MGVIEEFNNHELELAAQCQAIPKEQEFTELCDNIKHKLIFAFEGEWTSEAIIETAYTKINEYLDAEEPTIPEIPSNETKEPQGTTQIPPLNPKLFENKYAKYINKILEFAYEKQLNIVDIVAGIGLDKSNKTEHKGITRLCKELVENGLMRVSGGKNKRLYTALVRSMQGIEIYNEVPKSNKQPSNKKSKQPAKPDELDTKEIRISYNVQKAMRENPDLLEELLTSNNYDVEYVMKSSNCTELSRIGKVSEPIFDRLRKISVERGAKDINEVIIRLLEGNKKQKNR